VKCINCKDVQLVFKSYKGITVRQCPKCESMWLTKKEFREFKDKTDEFLCWLDVELWKKNELHKIVKTDNSCPDCSALMYNVEYHDSHISLPVCFACQGVWLDKTNQEKLFDYLEQLITAETVKGFVSEIGHDMKKGAETIKEEMRDLKTILVLIEYRIFSRFPTLEKIVSGLPK